MRSTGASDGETVVPAGGLFLRGAQAQPLAVRLRRFGDDFGEFAVGLPPVAGRGGVTIPIHGDAAGVPWRAQVSGIRGPVLVCGIAAAPAG
jgi:hypothetical protein